MKTNNEKHNTAIACVYLCNKCAVIFHCRTIRIQKATSAQLVLTL